MKYELREMVRTGQGSIVNTASVAGLMPEASQGAYVAAKHGVIGLTKTAAFENAHLGIRVNALAPGWVRTPLTAGLEDATGVIQKMKEAEPMHRAAGPEEMVAMVLFLCSDAASYHRSGLCRGRRQIDPRIGARGDHTSLDARSRRSEGMRSHERKRWIDGD